MVKQEVESMRRVIFLGLVISGVVSANAWAEHPVELAESISLVAQEHPPGHQMPMEQPASQTPNHSQHSQDQLSKPQQTIQDEHTEHHQDDLQSTPTQPEGKHEHQQDATPMETIELETDDKGGNWQQELIMTNIRRDGSGTGWIPMDNPMLMKMGQWKNWTGMLHWSAFADYDHQTGPRGDNGFYSQNWVMASAASPVRENGVMQFRAMLSLEPLTVGKHGYPVLFQTGETYQNEPLVDRQHPHDLFMELSAQYYHRLNDDTLLRVYLAPVGEPALGPVAFPHRYSSFLNPDSPQGHHVQDSTHIAFGVATAGLIYKNKWQVEGSVFNGKEPDEDRYDFDYNTWKTAYSGRVSYLPNRNWAIQTSYGFLQEPEALEPGDIHRVTSSIQHSKNWDRGWLATSLVWGHNFTTEGPDEDSILVESVINFRDKNYAFGRIEHAYKHGLFGHHDVGFGFDEHDTFHLTSFSLGVARDLFRINNIPITLGGMITMSAKPGRLDNAYGDFPMGFHVFLHTNAPRMRMSHQGH